MIFRFVSLLFQCGNYHPTRFLDISGPSFPPLGPRSWVGADMVGCGDLKGFAHNTVSSPNVVWDRLGSAVPDREPFHSSDAAQLPNPPPRPWLSVTVALQTVGGQRLTQQPHIRHGSRPLCPYKRWMVNHPIISLLECGFEFLQRWTHRPQEDHYKLLWLDIKIIKTNGQILFASLCLILRGYEYKVNMR